MISIPLMLALMSMRISSLSRRLSLRRNLFSTHRSLFSETLSPNRYIRAPPMTISIKNSLDKANDPSLHRFKPCAIPLNIKPQARDMISQMELQGVIRRMKPNEQPKFCAPAGFMPKKSGKLRFVIDFTALNKNV